MIVANHVSYLDGPILAYLFGNPKIVAKAEARNTPMFGRVMDDMEVIFVQRNDPNSREATKAAIRQHSSDWRPGQRPLLVFPEGTTRNGKVLSPFRTGAFEGGVPVRPVIIVYTGQFDPSNPKFRETAHGIEEMSDAAWAAKLLTHLSNSVHIRVLAPYIPNEDEQADPYLYASNVQSFMAKEQDRIREEVHQSSWKAAAGRTTGGDGYKCGDV